MIADVGLPVGCKTVTSAFASVCRERVGGLERPPVLHCAADETSQGFDDVGMKWQKLLVSRKHKDSVV